MGILMRGLLLPLFLVAIDIICTIATAFAAVFLRFEGTLPPQYVAVVVAQLPALVVIRIGVLKLFHLYNRAWRYASVNEAISIVTAVFISGIGWFGYARLIGVNVPRSIQIISAVLMIMTVGLSRLALRTYSNFTNQPGYLSYLKAQQLKKVLIVGAGDAGAMIAREIGQFHTGKRQVVGFVDDADKKQGQTLYGARVLGKRNDIGRLVSEIGVEEIIIAMPSIKGRAIREIIELCKHAGCDIKIIPGVYEIIEGNVNTSQLRPIEVEDLLGREAVKLDTHAVSKYLNNKVVLVTGAGGSIGSEICRQVAKMGPKKILLLGKGENSIYEINSELGLTYPQLKKIPIIADVRDRDRIAGIMDYFKPQVIFHAAAHKHVPLMEYQPVEAVRNNVLGTKVLAEEADRVGAETFVMISTDKAVNPTSVMGCTKRVAEMFVQSMNAVSRTHYVAVRFGNVLGSRGSVIPLFKKQIARGGPVTVTHPEMKRYFMTIPEASQLVLQAGAMAKGGEVFVLDMGEPVKIVDLAKDLITLSGYIPEVDIPIQFTGLRPGEKLFEELLSAEDGTEHTQHEKIFTARLHSVDKDYMDGKIAELLAQSTGEEVVAVLQQVVPTYTPNRIDD
ncbi:MAG: nucleoside-diphosphate sugar epimerase/dehydratase [Acidaminococcaceae bacterium]